MRSAVVALSTRSTAPAPPAASTFGFSFRALATAFSRRFFISSEFHRSSGIIERTLLVFWLRHRRTLLAGSAHLRLDFPQHQIGFVHLNISHRPALPTQTAKWETN